MMAKFEKSTSDAFFEFDQLRMVFAMVPRYLSCEFEKNGRTLTDIAVMCIDDIVGKSVQRPVCVSGFVGLGLDLGEFERGKKLAFGNAGLAAGFVKGEPASTADVDAELLKNFGFVEVVGGNLTYGGRKRRNATDIGMRSEGRDGATLS
jgi:hypothetical protein